MESTITTNATAFALTGSGYSAASLYTQQATWIPLSQGSGPSSEDRSSDTILPGDQVSLSPEALAQSGQAKQAEENNPHNTEVEEQQQSDESAEKQTSSIQLTQAEQQQVRELAARDQEVRTHEQAHLSAAGQYAAGGMQFTYQNGPDGKRYAVGGEVPIDVSEENTPKATIDKMQVIRNAALAPASPSSADRQIAATATQKEAAARVEMQAEERSESAPEAKDGDQIDDETPSGSATEVQEAQPDQKYTPFAATA